MQLPFEMVSKGRCSGEELFEGGSVFLIFEFLGLISRIEIVLKLATEIYFFKSVPRGLSSRFVARLV